MTRRSRASGFRPLPYFDGRAVAVSYLPFLTSPTTTKRGLPGRVARQLRRDQIFDVSDLTQREGLLREYVADLEFLIYPDCHRNLRGEPFTNISYYSRSESPEAFSRYQDGVCQTVVSTGQVRLFTVLALEVYQSIQPILFNSGRAPARTTGRTVSSLLRYTETIDGNGFRAVTADYPGVAAVAHAPAESEFLLFADMLRFV